ncbi:hypothetical protein ACH5RR_021433 [Cinchona calisaya]|uniref:Uncharacterized protein n=1 Tax=Cinchona calisaya TaxID=153742 RepID=A0ABD2ZI80_9GENT
MHRVNSAKLAGGFAPAPLHETSPDPQSAVLQTNFPELLLEQNDLAQTRPDHGAGTSIETDDFEGNSNPVVDGCAAPPPVRVAGHTV